MLGEQKGRKTMKNGARLEKTEKTLNLSERHASSFRQIKKYVFPNQRVWVPYEIWLPHHDKSITT